MQAYIGGFLQNQKNKWKNHNSLIIYFAGSNFKTEYIGNQRFKDQKKEFLIDTQIIKEQIRKDSHMIDSIILTGGEPCLQPQALKEILKLAKKEGLQTMLITNGTKPEVLNALKEYIDLIRLEIYPLNENWKEIVKCSEYFIEDITLKNNILKTINSFTNIEFETIIIPGILFRIEQFLEIARIIPENKTWHLKCLENTNNPKNLVQPSEEYLNLLKKEILAFKNLNLILNKILN